MKGKFFMRLNKFLASCGVGSRRKCDELIAQGRVKVGDIVATLGTEVDADDKVYVDDKLVSLVEEKFYFAFNKPKGCITTMSDDRGRTTVIDVFEKAYQKKFNQPAPKVFAVGRLDYNTQGLLFLTNDGDFANSLMHPSKKISKTYKVTIFPHLTSENVENLQNGVMIDGEKTLPSIVKILQTKERNQVIEMTIFQGRNRQVRKMLQSVGVQVNDLVRTKVGNFNLGDIKCGDFKKLSPEDLSKLTQSK